MCELMEAKFLVLAKSMDNYMGQEFVTEAEKNMNEAKVKAKRSQGKRKLILNAY